MENKDKMSRRIICSTVFATMMIVVLRRPISYAQPTGRSSTQQTTAEFDHKFSKKLLKNLHGAANSIGIDYTPEARCSDNNWFTRTPVACNPQLSFMCTGNNPLSTCPSSCQSCYNGDLANLKNSLGVSTITSYQPNYYILTTAQNLKIKVLQGTFNDAIPSLA